MKIIDKSLLWQGRFLRAVHIKYLFAPQGAESRQTGNIFTWESVERVGCRGIVAIVPITSGGDVVMIRQFRPPVNNYVLELPAGLVAHGEQLVEAAHRELLEETGYAASRMDYLMRGPMSSGLSSEILDVFLATGLEYKGASGGDETEQIDVLQIPLVNFYDHIVESGDDQYYIDLKVFGLVELAKRRL